MMSHYGIQTVADKKFIQLIQGISSHKAGNTRMTLFASFMQILPYNEGDFEFYLKGLYFMTKQWYLIKYLNFGSTLGNAIVNSDYSEVQLVPLIRAVEFARKYFQPRLRKDDWQDLKRKVNNLHKNILDRRN